MLIRHNYDGKRGGEPIHVRLSGDSLSLDGILLLCDMFLTHGAYEVVLQRGEQRADLMAFFKSLLPYRRIHIIKDTDANHWDNIFTQLCHYNFTAATLDDIDCDILIVDTHADHSIDIELLAQKTSIIQLICQ